MILGFLLFAGAGCLIAVLILAGFGRTERSRQGAFSGGALSFLGSASLSSFILIAAFLIAGSWANLNTARGHTFDESRALNAAYTDADATTRPLLKSYVESVIAGSGPRCRRAGPPTRGRGSSWTWSAPTCRRFPNQPVGSRS
ncbi:hypothetical protein ACFQZC_30175 [Streptacidiphilus monticola]